MWKRRKMVYGGSPRRCSPTFSRRSKRGIHFIIPVGILIAALVMNYSPMMAGFIAILALYLTRAHSKGLTDFIYDPSQNP